MSDREREEEGEEREREREEIETRCILCFFLVVQQPLGQSEMVI